MEHNVEKLLYSRHDAAEALSLSIRSIDYLIATGRLSSRRIGSKILIPAGAIRRFAKEDHPESVRVAGEAWLSSLEEETTCRYFVFQEFTECRALTAGSSFSIAA